MPTTNAYKLTTYHYRADCWDSDLSRNTPTPLRLCFTAQTRVQADIALKRYVVEDLKMTQAEFGIESRDLYVSFGDQRLCWFLDKEEKRPVR